MKIIVPRHQYNTRRSENTVVINCRTSYYQNSFLPSSVKLWNEVPVEVRNNSSIFSFKRYLNRNQLKLPKYFQYGTRKEQILVARLRLNCSSLRQHLFSRNLVDLILVHVAKQHKQRNSSYFTVQIMSRLEL